MMNETEQEGILSVLTNPLCPERSERAMDHSPTCEPAAGKTSLNRRQIAAAAAGVLGSLFGPSVGLAAPRKGQRRADRPEPERTPVSPEAAAVAEIAGLAGVRSICRGSRPRPGLRFRAAAATEPMGRACSWAGPPPGAGPTSWS
jgi:hypothetical protein